uniref:Uncharacterized protein n=1 Tax=Anopheles melas TaxID=34690 RepID=A0A182TSR7_9DIPT
MHSCDSIALMFDLSRSICSSTRAFSRLSSVISSSSARMSSVGTPAPLSGGTPLGSDTVGRSGGRVGCDRNTAAAARHPILRSVLPVAGGRTRSAVIGAGATTDYTRDRVTVQAGHGMCETGKQSGRGARWTTAGRKNLGAGRGSRRPNQQRTGPGHQATLDALAVAAR